MAAPAIQVRGLDEFRRELRSISGARVWSAHLGRAHREIGKLAEGLSRARARAMGGQQAHFAMAIRGRGTVRSARIGVRPQAATAFWGALSRTGWYAHRRYRTSSSRQHPRWVGNSWDVGRPGGPYAINDAIAQNLRSIEGAYVAALDRVTARAFPNR